MIRTIGSTRTPTKFADTVTLHASLLSGEVADGYKQVGLTLERFNKAFHATMETIASESQANDGSNISSRLVASVWKVHLDVQLDNQQKELAAATAATDARL